MTVDPDESTGRGPVIRDRRRVDPETGELRERQETAAPGSSAAGGPSDPPSGSTASDLEAQLLERTADLQRLQAEYLNYKRRVDRDRENARKNAIASSLTALLPVLDDIARAREHEELTGGFKAVAESFEGAVAKLGLTSFGAVGDEFDPRIHEALMHSYSDDVTGPTCSAILQVGYAMSERILRPARVAVAEPSQPAEPGPAAESDGAGPAEAGSEPAEVASGSATYDDNDSVDDGGPSGSGA
ncbi:MAG: nucleotide exchange factor GrpE [Nocardioidaceae bacterium]